VAYNPYCFDDSDWAILLDSIQTSQCLPILGAGAAYGAVPLGGQLAEELAKKFGYPMSDRNNLIRVSQYAALKFSGNFVKNYVIGQWFTNLPMPAKTPIAEPHEVLAELPLPIYLTTNYDDFMTNALHDNHRHPFQEMCRWNYQTQNRTSILDNPATVLNPANPIVFHLHGHAPRATANLQEKNQCLASLVLTEDDYLSLHVALERPHVIPQQIRDALVGSSLLIIGYSMADTTFRALYKGLLSAAGLTNLNTGFVVMPAPRSDSPEQTLSIQEYWETYFDALGMRVYWGDARTFSAELLQKYKAL